jgi:hypothetical protein
VWAVRGYVLLLTPLSCELADRQVADRLVLPNALVSAAEDALYAGQFLSRPTLWTVQTIAILTLCGHNVCESDLLSSLLAVGIKTAQTLNLHSMGRAASQLEKALASVREDERNIGGNGNGNGVRSRKVVDLELGKRLWWALAQEDWFAIPFRGVWCECSEAVYSGHIAHYPPHPELIAP